MFEHLTRNFISNFWGVDNTEKKWNQKDFWNKVTLISKVKVAFELFRKTTEDKWRDISVLEVRRHKLEDVELLI